MAKKKSNKVVYKKNMVLPPDKRKEKVEHVYNLLKDGWNRYDILTTIATELNASEEYVRDLITDAYELARSYLHKDKDYIFTLHMDRYEKIYNDSIKMENSWGQPLDPHKGDWKLMVAKYANAAKALRHKEQLLGLHDKNISIEVNNNRVELIDNEVEVRGPIAGMNLDKLSFEEQLQLLELLRKSRTVEIEGIQKVVFRQTKIEIDNSKSIVQPKEQQPVESDVIDTLYEELPQDVVSQMTVRIPENKEDEHLHEVDKLKKKHSKGMLDVQKKINDKDTELFMQLLKQKKNK